MHICVVCGRSGQTASRYSTCLLVCLVARGVGTRMQCSLPKGRSSLKGALVIRVVLSRSSLMLKLRCAAYTGRAAHHRTHLPRRQTYEHLPPPHSPLFFPLIIIHYIKQSPTDHVPRKHTLSPRSLSPRSSINLHHPRLPVPDTPSCDSTTARLDHAHVTPTTHHEHQPHLSTTCRPYPSLGVTAPLSPPSYTSYQSSHLSNHPSTSQGPQQQQPAIATSLPTLHQTIHGTPPMRALKSPNLWRIL